MAAPINASVVTAANQLLEFLRTQATKNWTKVMTDTLTEEERRLAHVALAKVLDSMGLEAPYGAYAGGTGNLKDAAGISEEFNQDAVKVLKATGRLLQCGKGRGKCQIVIDVTELSDEEIRRAGEALAPKAIEAPPVKEAVAAAASVNDDEDVMVELPASILALRAAVEAVIADYQQMMVRDHSLRTEVQKVQAALSEFEDLKAATTW